ncbi:MAG TPA: hypothetical protein VL574_02625, partial [Stellaceae bacterium]|jgi:hypothetical protein|nr:hypothetical protein [Stellaceae bacterium]
MNSVPDITQAGFVADEFQEIIPIGVTGRPNGVDATGKPVYQTVDATYAVPYLVAHNQQIQNQADASDAAITTLTTRVAALEAKAVNAGSTTTSTAT